VLRPGDVVVSPKLDRVFRSALDALTMIEELRRRGVALHLLDLGGDVAANGMSKLVLTILAAVAEAERDRIRERIAEVKRDQRGRGQYLGGKVPYGFTVGEGGVLVPVEAEQAAIARARALRAAGWTLRNIHAALREEGASLSLGALHRVVREVT
jgi:DNA invertase Pin-like site-specific DNA recombinase